MKPLEPPDSIHLEAAQGWCQLHAFEDANAELKKIASQLRAQRTRLRSSLAPPRLLRTAPLTRPAQG